MIDLYDRLFNTFFFFLIWATVFAGRDLLVHLVYLLVPSLPLRVVRNARD